MPCVKTYRMGFNFHGTTLSRMADFSYIRGFYLCGCWSFNIDYNYDIYDICTNTRIRYVAAKSHFIEHRSTLTV